ncbi:hypothetical protein Clacol_001287 [Clathrus columnatus]|uniref:Uncharacterized protein n=1 Tax=Clathrus columnatus TaxID=1419009 RepID=A0AAV5A1I3_9AGAM|nr:hypothetical protein Clacol_001287 [Clathrus columnatus]
MEIDNPIPLLTPEEEDALIHRRILSDDKALRKLIKKFYSYVFTLEYDNLPINPDGSKISLEEAREVMLAEIATFQLALQKSTLVYQAESRQVLEYEKEKQRIAKDQEVIREEISKLKIALEEEQLLRKRKIEYDQVAEKVNMLPTRAELQASIASIEEEIAAIRDENDHKARMMHARKVALDQIVSSVEALRILDKEPDSNSQPQDAPPIVNQDDGPQGDEQDDQEDDRKNRARERQEREREREREQEEDNEDQGSAPPKLNPSAKPFLPKGVLDRMQNSERGTPNSSRPHSAVTSPAPPRSEEGEEREEGEDIEMGEVSETIVENRANPSNGHHSHLDNELEEGEASDGGIAAVPN